jgi:hypothetical protein
LPITSVPLRHQPVHDAPTGDVQVARDLSLAFVGEEVESAWDGNACGEFGLPARAALVVPLVDRFHRVALNQKRREAGLIGRSRRESVQSNVNAHRARRVHVSGDYEALINDLHGIGGGVRHDPHLVDSRLAGFNANGHPDGTTEPRFFGARLIACSV